jgi:hypothetical protein
MDLNLLLNEAIGGRSGRRGGMLERLMRSFLWSAVNQAMSTALETATAPVQARTESRAAAAMRAGCSGAGRNSSGCFTDISRTRRRNTGGSTSPKPPRVRSGD